MYILLLQGGLSQFSSGGPPEINPTLCVCIHVHVCLYMYIRTQVSQASVLSSLCIVPLIGYRRVRQLSHRNAMSSPPHQLPVWYGAHSRLYRLPRTSHDFQGLNHILSYVLNGVCACMRACVVSGRHTCV